MAVHCGTCSISGACDRPALRHYILSGRANKITLWPIQINGTFCNISRSLRAGGTCLAVRIWPAGLDFGTCDRVQYSNVAVWSKIAASNVIVQGMCVHFAESISQSL